MARSAYLSLYLSTPLPLYLLIWYKTPMFRMNTEKVLFDSRLFFQILKEIEFECNKNRGGASQGYEDENETAQDN